MAGTNADCWDAFGSDDDDDDDSEEGVVEIGQDISVADSKDPFSSKSASAAASEVTLFLAKSFLHTNSNVSIGQRRLFVNKDGLERYNVLEEALGQRGFEIFNSSHVDQDVWLDAVILICSSDETMRLSQKLKEQFVTKLVPGGLMLVVCPRQNSQCVLAGIISDPTNLWVSDPSSGECAMDEIFKDDNLQVLSMQKALCQIQDRSCLWLPSSHSLSKERARVMEATVPLSAHEIQSRHLSEPSLAKAVYRMQEYGFCILPRLLDPSECRQWGIGVLSDLHAASKILLDRERVNILNPHASEQDPQSYRELSMREDLRMDLRDGPQLRQLRGDNTNKPIILQSKQTPQSAAGAASNAFFRLHPSVLEVVRRTMNPKKGTLYKGNFGRHNFSGSGPDGSYQDMRLSDIGGIVSLPGSADQAMHADAPHLFENQTLPAHYINAFALGCAGDPLAGCTAFVHGSHRIEFTAEYLAEDEDGRDDKHKVFEFLVRPQFELGDVVLFDCRTLHFGLANMSKDVERPLLYCNMTHAWFHDPKNWDNHHPIFDSF